MRCTLASTLLLLATLLLTEAQGKPEPLLLPPLSLKLPGHALGQVVELSILKSFHPILMQLDPVVLVLLLLRRLVMRFTGVGGWGLVGRLGCG